jgi:hypothetical protein
MVFAFLFLQSLYYELHKKALLDFPASTVSNYLLEKIKKQRAYATPTFIVY